jgi:RNA polymerase sigma-70 factor (ECF subfamily)
MNEIPAELVRSAMDGDAAAFERIYRLSSGFVYTVALRVLGNAADAEDLTQEVFVKVHASLGSFAFRSSFKTWLYRVTMNMTINAYHRKSRDARRRADLDEASAAASCEGGQRRELASDEAGRALGALLGRLTAEHRAVIVLRELEGLSYEEMSAALGININTVRTRLRRAREALMAHGGKEVIGHAM